MWRGRRTADGPGLPTRPFGIELEGIDPDGGAPLDADKDVGVPGPRMLQIEGAGLGRVVRVGMVDPEDALPLGFALLLEPSELGRVDQEAVGPLFPLLVLRAHDLLHPPGGGAGGRGGTDEEAAGLLRVGLLSVLPQEELFRFREHELRDEGRHGWGSHWLSFR